MNAEMIQEAAAAQSYLQIHPDDNVLVALKDLPSGTPVTLKSGNLILQQDIAAKHKFFIRDMMPGEEVIMYGTLVGKVQVPVSTGGLMTTQNTKHAAGAYAYRGFHYHWQKPDVSRFINRTFNGYIR